jgi:hypothetical protein
LPKTYRDHNRHHSAARISLFPNVNLPTDDLHHVSDPTVFQICLRDKFHAAENAQTATSKDPNVGIRARRGNSRRNSSLSAHPDAPLRCVWPRHRPCISSERQPRLCEQSTDSRASGLSRASVSWLCYTAAESAHSTVPRLHATTISMLHDASGM